MYALFKKNQDSKVRFEEIQGYYKCLVIEASHAHVMIVMRFLPPHCELSIFVTVSVIF
jgi:hypothetical protein